MDKGFINSFPDDEIDGIFNKALEDPELKPLLEKNLENIMSNPYFGEEILTEYNKDEKKYKGYIKALKATEKLRKRGLCEYEFHDPNKPLENTHLVITFCPRKDDNILEFSIEEMEWFKKIVKNSDEFLLDYDERRWFFYYHIYTKSI